jgi:hypothetical protein
MWLISFPLSILIALLLMAAGYSRGADTVRPPDAAVAAFGVLVLSPLIETILLAATITLLSRLFRSPYSIAVGSAVVWAVLHSLLWAPWGIIIAWLFYVMSRSYIAWRPLGFARAFFIVVFIHAAHNLLGALAMLA